MHEDDDGPSGHDGTTETADGVAETEMVVIDANELDELRRSLAEADDRWRRAAADLANLQKRFRREIDRGQAAERARVLTLWLGTVDDLHRALGHAASDGAAAVGGAEFVDGVEAIVKHATATIATLGYPRFGEVGDVFDPTIHEVVSTVPASDHLAANAVVGVVKPGYGSAEDLLRPASVVVAKEPD